MPQYLRRLRPLLMTAAASLFFVGLEAQSPSFEPLQWSKPVFLSALNTEFDESLPTLSADGRYLLFTSNRSGRFHDGDNIWVSERTALGGWGAPRYLGSGINSGAHDRSPALSPDGRVLLFASDRVGGNLDLWGAIGSGDPFAPWQAPFNLGPPNTSSLDFGPALLQEGEGGPVRLYFSSLRTGNADIFVSTGDDFRGRFSEAVPVPELNSPANDARPTFRGDGLALIFDSTRLPPPGSAGGKRDLWASTRPSTAHTWSTPQHLNGFNTEDNDSLPALSFDGRMLVFTSDRQGGDLDLYISVAK